MSTHVDMTEVLALLVAATERGRKLDGQTLPEGKKDRVAALAEIQRETLYLAHLCDKARALVLDEYHLVRGFTDHITLQPNEEQS